MTISELIAALEALKAQYGDLPVESFQGSGGDRDVCYVPAFSHWPANVAIQVSPI